jgi:DNA-binding GntR family transcriptional regulator
MEITKREARENAREYALRQIQENIENLQLKPGSTVSENELAKELGLSRTPVREALQELQKSNLIEVYPQRGIIIARIDFEVVAEMAFLRCVLEKAVVEALCDCITEENILELERNIKLQEFYLNSKSAGKIYELDNEFHRDMFVMCHKERIYGMMEATQVHFNRVRTLSLYSVKDLKTVEEHKAILSAVMAGDKTLAAELITNHLSRYKLEQNEIMAAYPEYFK